jgi:hypothetical protein
VSSELAFLLDTRPVRLTRTAVTAIGLMLILALGAYQGGWAMLTAGPGQAPLGMPLSWLQGSPFTSYFIPGLLLFSVFCLGSLVAVAAALLRHWLAPHLAMAIGVGQMIWIVTEVVLTRQAGFFFLQPVLFVWGALLALLAYLWWRAPRGRQYGQRSHFVFALDS